MGNLIIGIVRAFLSSVRHNNREVHRRRYLGAVGNAI